MVVSLYALLAIAGATRVLAGSGMVGHGDGDEASVMLAIRPEPFDQEALITPPVNHVGRSPESKVASGVGRRDATAAAYVRKYAFSGAGVAYPRAEEQISQLPASARGESAVRSSRDLAGKLLLCVRTDCTERG